MTTADYSAYATDTAPSAEGANPAAKLKELSNLAERQRALEVEIAGMSDKLKKKEEELARLSEQDIPTIMDELDLEEFSTKSGLKVIVREKIRAQISESNAPKAFAWLDDHGFEKLVKRTFVIEFQKDEEAWANKFEGDLAKRKKPLHVARKKAVHPSTLVSFVTERLTSGDTDFPQELFGVFRQRFSKVEVKK